MNYFGKVRQFDGIVIDARGKRTKFKSGKTAVFQKSIVVALNVILTDTMRQGLPKKFAEALQRTQKARRSDPVVDFIKARWAANVGVRFFSPENRTGKPLVEKGFPSDKPIELNNDFANDDHVTLTLKGFEVNEENDMMKLIVQMVYDEDTWAWAGEIFDGQNVVCQVTPLKGKAAETPLLGGKGEGDDDEDEETGDKGTTKTE